MDELKVKSNSFFYNCGQLGENNFLNGVHGRGIQGEFIFLQLIDRVLTGVCGKNRLFLSKTGSVNRLRAIIMP